MGRTEIKVEFQIEDKNYILFIEKKFWNAQIYLFQKTGEKEIERIPIEKVTTSTTEETLRYWWLILKLYFRQKMKKKSGKTRGGNA